jgi:L-asparagine transporter-like permease
MADRSSKAITRDPNQIAYRIVIFWLAAFIVALAMYLIERHGH